MASALIMKVAQSLNAWRARAVMAWFFGMHGVLDGLLRLLRCLALHITLPTCSLVQATQL